MADKIGINDNEYTAYLSQIEKEHDTFITGLESIIKQINNVNMSGGGLQSQDVTTNLHSLSTSINTIKKSIDKLFESEKQTIESFKNSIVNYDSTD